jgi:hypothetical protein
MAYVFEHRPVLTKNGQIGCKTFAVITTAWVVFCYGPSSDLASPAILVEPVPCVAARAGDYTGTISPVAQARVDTNLLKTPLALIATQGQRPSR